MLVGVPGGAANQSWRLEFSFGCQTEQDDEIDTTNGESTQPISHHQFHGDS
jgi:hypothetical protein